MVCEPACVAAVLFFVSLSDTGFIRLILMCGSLKNMITIYHLIVFFKNINT